MLQTFSLLILIIKLTSCSNTRKAQPTIEAITPLTSTRGATVSPVLLTPAETVIPTQTPSPTETADPCSNAVMGGARQKYTFDKIVSCLNTPQKLVSFMSNNLKWDGGWDANHFKDNAYSPAAEVYSNGVDDCDGLAEFGACVLSKNGFEAYNVGISILGPQGHNVTGFVGDDGAKYAISNGQAIDGPFDSWEELAQFYIELGVAAPEKGVIWLFLPCIPGNAVGDAVLDLPYTVIR